MKFNHIPIFSRKISFGLYRVTGPHFKSHLQLDSMVENSNMSLDVGLSGVEAVTGKGQLEPAVGGSGFRGH